jgi:hypothetical protein
VVHYASAIGSLQYAQVCTHPDLAFVTGILGRYQDNSGIEHLKMVKKTLLYMQGTKGLMLTYRKSDSLEIEEHSDSDFAEDVDDRKSTLGHVFTLAKELYSGKAPSKPSQHHQQCMPSLKKFVPGLKVVDIIQRPLKMYYDNELAVFYAHNNKSSDGAKHMDIKFYVVKEKT